jgi:hypothetical protein
MVSGDTLGWLREHTMQRVEVTRVADSSVSDQLAEMRRWLDAVGIQASDLQPVRILTGRVIFGATTFQATADADRFIREFADLGWRKR